MKKNVVIFLKNGDLPPLVYDSVEFEPKVDEGWLTIRHEPGSRTVVNWDVVAFYHVDVVAEEVKNLDD